MTGKNMKLNLTFHKLIDLVGKLDLMRNMVKKLNNLLNLNYLKK